ncbi:LuxR C-terminal-related transcriptional regulator [Streptomyces sporangiiformans]|uniref:HTH luxR-type domain-containing protein n=2 Tax=Streptomyces sporangiiformans TaxID=2315329 RepID=A0A505DRK5_9ACTN|nr:LuxR C-terminal-related transcriptional regulator [Streptomyces sporangiiformans]TPQ23805.1 hypothetical protein FGD71_002150 [Streptomyces sporangiiformans]
MSRAARRIPGLTDQESVVFALLHSAPSTLDISRELNISERTAKFHISNMRTKLGGISRLQLCLLSALSRLGQLDRLGQADRLGQTDRLGQADRIGQAEQLNHPDRLGPAGKRSHPDALSHPDKIRRTAPPDGVAAENAHRRAGLRGNSRQR